MSDEFLIVVGIELVNKSDIIFKEFNVVEGELIFLEFVVIIFLVIEKCILLVEWVKGVFFYFD